MPMGALSVSGDVVTSGGEGLSLVKGVQLVLKAVGLSIKPGAEVGSIAVGGKIATTGDDVNTVEIEGHLGRLSALAVFMRTAPTPTRSMSPAKWSVWTPSS